MELPKMGDGSVPFVTKAMEYAESNATFVPGFVNVTELKKDVDAVNTLTLFLRQLDEIHDLVEDTIMLAGSEAYVAALAFYNAVKLGARMNIPGAEPIYDDLKQRFAGQGQTSQE